MTRCPLSPANVPASTRARHLRASMPAASVPLRCNRSNQFGGDPGAGGPAIGWSVANRAVPRDIAATPSMASGNPEETAMLRRFTDPDNRNLANRWLAISLAGYVAMMPNRRGRASRLDGGQ